jgi:hypothetical protein
LAGLVRAYISIRIMLFGLCTLSKHYEKLKVELELDDGEYMVAVTFK